MKHRLRTATSLLLLVSLLGSSGLLTYSTEQTPTLAKFTPRNTQSAGQKTRPNQAAPGSPCLTPSAADISSAQVQPGSFNSPIPGSVVPAVRSGRASRTGSLPGSQPIQLELAFSLRNPTQFNQCLDSIMDPQSTNYGNFLNATTLLPYIPTPGEKASVTSFLTNAGFTVTPGASPLVLQLSGTVAEAETTFGVSLSYYLPAGQSLGSSFYAINTDPTLPTTYANLVTGIMGLDNYSIPRPTESPCTGPYCPQGIQVGYSLTNLYNAGDNGAGQTVAIVDAPGDPNIQTSVNTFSAQYSLTSVTLNVLTPDGVPSSYDPGWASETAMDVEAVHTVAPGASITLLYGSSTSDDLVNLIDYVASNHVAKIVSNSWDYDCGVNMPCSDTQLPLSPVLGIDSRLATDAAQGVTILFASGDQGAKPDGSVFGTEFPASDPNVLSVGATNLGLTGCGTTTCTGYGSETGASISGGGYSGVFSEPSWQTSTIGSTATKCTTGHLHPDCRAAPDISTLGLNPGIWVYSAYVNMCVSPAANHPGWFGCSGTSLSTPLWAGFLGVALQVRNGAGFGNIGPLLYQTANNAVLYAADFHDITSGSNNGYSAGTGWDPVTGWGTPIASNLAFTFGSVVVFKTVPTTFPLSTTAGSISACGTTFTNGGVGSQDICTPSFTATENLPTPTTGWQFDHWSWTGGVSCSSSTLTTTACTFTSSGSLTATFRAQVTFTISPALTVIGWGTCAGPGQSSGSNPYETNFGTVSACYVPIGYSVSSWVCTAGLTCSGSSDVTPVSFIAPGTITLNLQSGSIPLPAQTNITASPSISNPAHGTMFTVSGVLRNVSNGVGLGGKQIALVFSWSTNIVTVTTLSNGTYSYAATAPATPGPCNVDAFFLGDYSGSPQYLPSKATAMVNVT